MKLLLDTHALIWSAIEPRRLSGSAAAAITDPANTIIVSSASAWEVSIKRRRGGLIFPPVTRQVLLDLRMQPLDVSVEHAVAVEELPDLHKDPFDRILVAQARVEGCVLVSRDPLVRAYDVPTLWD